MAALNVAEWSPEQVADWLTGLGGPVLQYVEGLQARRLDGRRLLMLRCDDLEYLGIEVIGHQELLLEAVEHLRNFQYELSRECIQQLALKLSVVATSLARQLRHHADARLDTQTLADVARQVHAVKPLVCWLDRWAACSTERGAATLGARRSALLKLALEAATCAHRDRFAEQPARAVAAAAATTAAAADHILHALDPSILSVAGLDAVCVRQRGRPLGFEVVPSYCGHHQLADIRFGSPAHASGQVHKGDEIVQVGNQCVIGWSGAAVMCACAAAGEELSLRLRRRGARPPPALPHAPRPPPRALYVPSRLQAPHSHSIMGEVKETKEAPASSSDESEPLSPPASPGPPASSDHSRMYWPKPRALVRRRHSVGGGSPPRRPPHAMEQFWLQLREGRRAGDGSAGATPTPPHTALRPRDKAVSYGTGLETSRPRTCLGLGASPPAAAPAPGPPSPPSEEERARGRLDKSHSTPAYDLQGAPPTAHPAIPESPPAPPPQPPNEPLSLLQQSAEKAGQILEFLKSSSQIGEAMQQRRAADEPPAPGPAAGPSAPPGPPSDAQASSGTGPRDETTAEKILETINIAMMEHRRRSLLEPPARPQPPHARRDSVISAGGARGIPGVELGVLRAVPPAPPLASPLKHARHIDIQQISAPLRNITAQDMRAPPSPPSPPSPPPPHSDIVVGAQADGRGALSPSSAVRGIFPTSKSRSLKKKSSILAKRRSIPARWLAARGAAGGVWQRVRGRAAATPRWARRHLLLAHNLLYAYRAPDAKSAHCMIYLEGFTVCAAHEVKSRAHAFKVYHTGKAFYFAADTRDAMLAWIQLIHRATLLPSLLTQSDLSNNFSETDYSETESDAESPEKRGERDRDRDRDKDKDKDKSKFGSLKKLTGRMQRSESQEHVPHAAAAAATSLDRKYLRFFSRNKTKDDSKLKSKASQAPVPTEQYRSYRRLGSPCSPLASPPSPPARAPRLPKPLHYIHASNPNLLDFEKSDFVTKPMLQPPKPKVIKGAESVGLVTLEQFMLQKQAEERRQQAHFAQPPAHHAPHTIGNVESVGLVTLEQFMLQKQAEERRQQAHFAQPPAHHAPHTIGNVESVGLVTLEQFMLQKQAEERRQQAHFAQPPAHHAPHTIGNVESVGLVTLEQFMLQKQAEERRQQAHFAQPPAHHAPHTIGNVESVGLVTLEQFMLQKQAEERRQQAHFAQPPAHHAPHTIGNVESVGLVTLEQFMLQKQAEERRQQAHFAQPPAHHAPHTIVADVIYGEVCAPHSPHSPHSPSKPTSVKGKDGYEKIVYPASPPSPSPSCSGAGYESLPPSPPPAAPALPAAQADRWRDSLRRNDKVHTRTDASPAIKPAPAASPSRLPASDSWNNNNGGGGGGAEGGAGPGVSRLRLMFGGGRATNHSQSPPAPPTSGAGAPYPHLQCPPLFHAETYSLRPRARAPPPPPRPAV